MNRDRLRLARLHVNRLRHLNRRSKSQPADERRLGVALTKEYVPVGQPADQFVSAPRHLRQRETALGVRVRVVGVVGDEESAAHPEVAASAAQINDAGAIESPGAGVIGIGKRTSEEGGPARLERMEQLLTRHKRDRLT